MTDFKVQSMREALEQVYNPSDILEEYDEENVQQLDEVGFLAPLWWASAQAATIARALGPAALKAYRAWKKAKDSGKSAKELANMEKNLNKHTKAWQQKQGKSSSKNGKKDGKKNGEETGKKDGKETGKKDGKETGKADAAASPAEVAKIVRQGGRSLPKRVALAIAKNPIKSSIVGGVLYYGGKAILGDDGKPIRMSEEERNRIIQKSKKQKDKRQKDQKFSKTKDGTFSKYKKPYLKTKDGKPFMGPIPKAYGPKAKEVQDDIMKMRKKHGGYGMPDLPSTWDQAKGKSKRWQDDPEQNKDAGKKPPKSTKKSKKPQAGTGDHHPSAKPKPQAGTGDHHPSKISTLIQKRKDKTTELAKTGKGPDAYKVAGEKRQQDRLDPNRSDAKAKRKESEKPPLTKKQKMAQKKIDSLPTHTATQREYKQKTQIGFDKHLKKTNENFDLDEASQAFDDVLDMNPPNLIKQASGDNTPEIRRRTKGAAMASKNAYAKLRGDEKKEADEYLKTKDKPHKLSADDLEKVRNKRESANELDEAMSSSQISQLKKAFEPMRGKKISMSSGDKLRKILDKVSDDKNVLVQLYKADIPFVSRGAATRLISKHDMKGAEINKLMAEDKKDFKVENMRDAMKEVWKNSAKMQEKRKEKENGLRVLKAGKTMTGGQPAYVQLHPKLDTKPGP